MIISEDYFIFQIAIFKENLVYEVEEIGVIENIVVLYDYVVLIPVLVVSGGLFPLDGVLFHPLLNDFTS